MTPLGAWRTPPSTVIEDRGSGKANGSYLSESG